MNASEPQDDPLQAQPSSFSYFARLRIIFGSRNFVVILVTNYTGLFFLAAFIYLNLFFRDIGISYFELGIANSWGMAVGLFGTLLGGYWADFAGGKFRKPMAVGNKFIAIFTMLTFAIATDLLGVLLALTFFGIRQFTQSSLEPILYESLPPEHLGTALSLFTIGGFFGLLGLVLVGILIQDSFVGGLRAFFLLAAVSMFIDFLLRLFFLEDTARAHIAEEKTLKSFVHDIFQDYQIGIKVLVATIPLFLIIYLTDVVSDICYGFAQTFFLNEDAGMSYSNINYIMIGATFIGVIGGLFAGSLLDKSENEAKVMFLAYMFLPVSVFLLLLSPSHPKWITGLPQTELGVVIASTAFVAVVIKGGNDVVWRTLVFGAVGRKLPREHTGKVTSLLRMLISLIGIILMPIAGYIYQTEGGVPLLATALILNVLILSALLIGWLRNSHTTVEPTPKQLIPV
ncbi:MAG: MFS transporter [Candidatus Thorarchaeota archaeon]